MQNGRATQVIYLLRCIGNCQKEVKRKANIRIRNVPLLFRRVAKAV